MEISETAVYVHANLDAMQRILYNLISNAIRYSSDGKYLGVFCARTATAYVLMLLTGEKGL